MTSMFQSILASCSRPQVELSAEDEIKTETRADETASTSDDGNDDDVPLNVNFLQNPRKWPLLRRVMSIGKGSKPAETPPNLTDTENGYVFVEPTGSLRNMIDLISEFDCTSACRKVNHVEFAQPQQQQFQVKHSNLNMRPMDPKLQGAAMFRAAVATERNQREEDRPMALPLNSLVVTDVSELDSVSELTMRSSYGGILNSQVGDDRRMAYYAIGKHKGKGYGNRRCYFTGKLIVTPAPFYAGSVQQGLRTLVVFCLPSSIGLPKKNDLTPDAMKLLAEAAKERISSNKVSLSSKSRSTLSGYSSSAYSTSCKENSTTTGESSLPDSMALLAHLPEPSSEMLADMKRRFPDQFTTLPMQVRSAHCWQLFVKFCFFSGLPVAEGEPHYRIKSECSGHDDEIILSHEVIVAANGEVSASLLRRPNLKTFRYLQRHYHQQCSKLHKDAFNRKNWDVVLPEI